MVQGTQITYTGQAARPVQETADCLYAALEAQRGAGLKKTDLPSQGIVHIELTSSGFRFWRYTLSAAGPKATRVELESFKPAATEGVTGTFQSAFVAPMESCGIRRTGA